MEFNDHSGLLGAHAFLSASNHHWLRYDFEKLGRVFANRNEAARGTELHNFAAEAIRLGIKLKSTKQTLNMHVNDAIGFGMTPEQVLFYSRFAFGTTDAIVYKERNKLLRIHDLKNGITPSSMEQLKVYNALFCLEYNIKPGNITSILRIYQNDEIEECESEVDEISHIMDKIITFDKYLQKLEAA